MFFVLSLPGALLLPWGLLGRWMKPGAGVAAASLALGVPFSWAIDPAQQYSSGMLDALYLAVLVLLVYGTARVPFAAARRLALAQAACAAVFASTLLAVAMSATAADPNLRLKLRYGARYLVELLGPAPGLALLLFGTALTVALLRPRTGSTSLPT